jgi:hypothetical protein
MSTLSEKSTKSAETLMKLLMTPEQIKEWKQTRVGIVSREYIPKVLNLKEGAIYSFPRHWDFTSDDYEQWVKKVSNKNLNE